MCEFDFISLAMILLFVFSFPNQVKPWMLFIALFYVVVIVLPTKFLSKTGKTKAKKNGKRMDTYSIFFLISAIPMILFRKIILLRLGMSVWVIYYFIKKHFKLMPRHQMPFIQEAKFISVFYVFLATCLTCLFLQGTNDYFFIADIFFIVVFFPPIYITKVFLIVKSRLTGKSVFFNQAYMPAKIVDKPK